MNGSRQGTLSGQVALVTGAARGLGHGIATRLAQDGARVVLADREPGVVEAAAVLAGEAEGAVCDVADSAAVDRLVGGIVQRHGQLDILVANAGIGGGGPLLDMADDAFHRILAVNLEGTFYCCRAAGRAMAARRAGAIVTFSSIFGRDTPAGSGAYGASKAGVIALTQSLARELAPLGIRANCVSPGNMATEMHWAALQRRADRENRPFDALRDEVRESVPLGRHGTPEDVAALVSFLVSTDAAYITGQTINVDGGVQPR
jgi:3-oxoacyl-[acyl-carrier protein] reductase